jgi:hypothetical protein
MRRLIAHRAFRLVPALMLVLVLAATPGCRRRKRAPVEAPPEAEQSSTAAGTAGSLVVMSDPRSSSQILNGFYGIENQSWRWSSGKFSVMLRPPRNAGQRGAVLVLHFATPEVVLSKLHSQTLTASIRGQGLGSQAYSKPGEQTYSRDVSGDLLKGEMIKVDFALDKTLPPSGSDNRELGVVVSSVGFEAK